MSFDDGVDDKNG